MSGGSALLAKGLAADLRTLTSRAIRTPRIAS
jgi:hypothetical protein